jgi:DNA-binding response OmpR family regulator
LVTSSYLVLGPKEYLVREILAQHAGKVVTRQQIMKQVGGGPHLDDTHYLRIAVRKLRSPSRTDRECDILQQSRCWSHAKCSSPSRDV